MRTMQDNSNTNSLIILASLTLAMMSATTVAVIFGLPPVQNFFAANVLSASVFVWSVRSLHPLKAFAFLLFSLPLTIVALIHMGSCSFVGVGMFQFPLSAYWFFGMLLASRLAYWLENYYLADSSAPETSFLRSGHPLGVGLAVISMMMMDTWQWLRHWSVGLVILWCGLAMAVANIRQYDGTLKCRTVIIYGISMAIMGLVALL